MLDRSTLGDWIRRACWWLRPLYDRVVSHVMTADKIFADDTSVAVLDPGRGQTKTGRFWCNAIDDRPWRDPLPLAAAYVYAVDRKGIRPAGHVEDLPANKPAATKPAAKKRAQKKAAPKVVEPAVETELADDAVQPEAMDTVPSE